MNAERRQTMKFISTLTGCFFLMIPCGFTWYWGNLSIYVYSYIHYHINTNSREVKTPWLLSFFSIMHSTAVIISGHLAKCFNKRVLLAFAILSFNGGFVTSYFIMGRSITWLDFTLGFFSGFGNGLLYSLVMQTVVQWSEKRVGLVVSAVIGGVSVGGIFTNQLVTHYINPKNFKVDTVIGKTKYFSQKDILENVPSLFLTLVAINLSFHLIGFCLIRLKPANPIDDEKKSEYQENNNIAINTNKTKSNNLEWDESSRPLLQGEINQKTKLVYLTNQGEMFKPAKFPDHESSLKIYDWEIVPVACFSQEKKPSKSPSEVLRSGSFYILWLAVASCDSCFLLLCNYYKALGQFWIKDDHFLTNLGTALSFTSMVMRLVLGYGMEHVNIKTSLVIFTSSLSIITSFYFFTPGLSKWVFFVWSLAYGSMCCGLYINTPSIMTRLYGKEHFHTNFGLLFTATIAINLIAPPVYRIILTHWGWFAIFATAGSLCLTSLLSVVLFLSTEKQNSK